eukprot:c8079_g1_i1.p1 GENE.c8079_g1_i1~~c8079_g1_i1.p1  ORF type:complete len:475 (-),score=104.87 c8079_g1_i1:90-1514(-)
MSNIDLVEVSPPTVVVSTPPQRSTGFPHAIRIFLTILRYFVSALVLSISIALLVTADHSNKPIPAVFGLIIVWVLIAWLLILEGGQNSLVALHSLSTNTYSASHPIAAKTSQITQKANNLDRFIIGRQFLAVLLLILINLCANTQNRCDDSLHFPQWIFSIFCDAGMSPIIITLILGQLTGQIIATDCMLDIINSYLMYFSTRISLFIEWSGVMHFVYLVQFAFTKLCGAGGNREHSAKVSTPAEKIGYGFRMILSCALLGFSTLVIVSEIVNNRTTAWKGVPPAAVLLIILLLIVIAGLMEGMQIALFAVLTIDRSTLQNNHPNAFRICQVVFREENLKAFLVGRQICVTTCVFLIAQLTTTDPALTDSSPLGLGNAFQKFVCSGILSAIFTTILASLAWRVVASANPILFLSLPFLRPFVWVCLGLDAIGLLSFSLVFARFVKWIFRMHPDTDHYSQSRNRLIASDTENSLC